METPEDIWEGDLFGRRAEAEQLIGYLETVAMRPSLREDGHAFVLAVDAPYGEGKSYFLRRFARHMAQSHPVAFVDAWTDDLEDEPLVALAATLDAALSPYADKSEELRKRIDAFKDKAGAVAKIVGIGLLKRVASFAIMESGAEGVGALVSGASELTKDLGKDVLKDAANGAVDGAADKLAEIVSGDMDDRIARFRIGRASIDGMKAALRAIVEHLGAEGTYPPPIVIVIDELDRCRPTYAIKLLEEVKHLFDVEGVAFVLGMHGGALAASVSAAYGAQFEGGAYLRRFINRQYALKPAKLEALVEYLIKSRAINEPQLGFPAVRMNGQTGVDLTASQYIALSMKSYGFNARSAFTVIDILETCVALSSNRPLLLPYLLPLIYNRIRGLPGMAQPDEAISWSYTIGNGFRSNREEIKAAALANAFEKAAKQDNDELMRQSNQENAGYALRAVAYQTFNNQAPNSPSIPRNYPRLLDTVDRFSAPSPTPA